MKCYKNVMVKFELLNKVLKLEVYSLYKYSRFYYPYNSNHSQFLIASRIKLMHSFFKCLYNNFI